MNTTWIVLCSILGLSNLALILIVLFRRGGQDTAALVAELTRQNSAIRESVLLGLGQIQEKVQNDLRQGRKEQFDTMKHELEGVADKLAKLHEATGTVVALSQGVQDLNTILSKPQGRGAFGEFTLERMLADLFGECTEMYALQHTLEGGERVDAAIFLHPNRSLFLSVDAKFPLAHATPLLEGTGTPEIEREFAKDVRARAAEIATKYIRPPATLDFAFMFVPSESIYYLVLKDAKLHQELLQKRVIPTSPNSFFAYLQALTIAFQGRKIEQKTVEIQRAVIQVAKDFAKFLGDYTRVGEKLEQASKAYEDSRKDVDRFTKRIDKLQLGEVKEPSPFPASE
jgi:DNA recombination protein RmuC